MSNIGRKVSNLRRKLGKSMSLPFGEVLPAGVVKRMMRKEGRAFRNRIYSPWISVLAFLSQVLDEDQCCRKAVSRVIAHCAGIGMKAPSSNTGGYCRARNRLPEGALYRLLIWVAERLQEKTKEKDLWCGRRVKIVDGTMMSMPDTSNNRKEYQQSARQAKGCGFPLVRLVGMFSMATGALVDVALGPTGEGELTLFKRILKGLNAGEVVLGDSGFFSYAHVVAVLSLGADIVLRLHKGRACNVRKVKRLGKGDNLIRWLRPKHPTKHLSKRTLLTLPEFLDARQVEFNIDVRGFRTKKIVIVTSLVDHVRHSAEDLAELYRARWDCELRLRDIKISMQMDILRGKTPEMVRKEIYMHLLAYNLIRTIMWNAAKIHKVAPLRLSVKGTLQHMATFSPLIICAPVRRRKQLYLQLLKTIASEVLPDRPNRIEPRLVKRRPKSYRWLTRPRTEWHKRLRA